MLTNIAKNADYHWRVNIDAIEANLGTLTEFPRIDTHYSGPTLFIAGSRSQHVTYVLCSVEPFVCSLCRVHVCAAM